jgi:transcriptional regulator with XRE-family HTH domain
MENVVRELLNARQAAGLSQVAVGRVIGVSHQQISRWETDKETPAHIHLGMWGSVVGLDVRLHAYRAGSPMRDAGQLRVVERARREIGEKWTWRTEVPVTTHPLDRRAIDAVIRRGEIRIGLEVITRLTDVQAQVRSATLKQAAAGLDGMILVLADTHHNRLAVRDAAATLDPAFPLRSREAMADLRAGRRPTGNAVIFI